MWRWLKRLLLSGLTLVLIWIGITLSGVLPRISAQQSADLAELRRPLQDAVGQRNALELIWSLSYQVPPEARAEVLAEDAAALDDWRPGEGEAPGHVAASRYPVRNAADAPPLPACEFDCLDKVRSDPESWRRAVTARASRLQALDALGDYDHQRLPYRLTLSSPIPGYQDTGSLQIAVAALQYVDGDVGGALQSLCRSTADWRALRGRTDSLIGEMINLAWLRRGVQLYADIRAELPTDHAVPASCERAFAPPRAEERMSCDVFRVEFQGLQSSLGQEHLGATGPEGGWVDRLATWQLNREATLALMAGKYVAACERISQPVAAWPALAEWEGCSLQHQLFNPIGCVVAGIAGPSYLEYLRRERDVEGQLRLLTLADHLSGQPDAASAFEHRPDVLRQFEQPVRVENGVLVLELLAPRSTGPTEVRMQLPGSRVPAGGDPE